EALMVVGCFSFLQGVLEGAVNPSMALLVEQVRKGTLDFVLLKPRDAQFLVSTARVLPWRSLNIVAALVLFVYGFRELGRTPSAPELGLSLILIAASVVVLYSLWVLSVSLAFYAVKVDNLSFFFGAVFDAARWPVNVFRGPLRFLFTFVVPLAVMTTFPAE